MYVRTNTHCYYSMLLQDPVETPPHVSPDEDLGTPVDGDPPFDKTAAVVGSKCEEGTSVDKDNETRVEHHVDGDGDGDGVGVGVGVSVGDGDGDGDGDIDRENVTPKEVRSSEEERLPDVSSLPESANSKEDKKEVVSNPSETGEGNLSCVRACMRVHVCVCVRACVHAYMYL